MKKALLTLALVVSGSVFAECDMGDKNGCGPFAQPETQTLTCNDPSCMAPADDAVKVACDNPSCMGPATFVPSFCDESDPSCNNFTTAMVPWLAEDAVQRIEGNPNSVRILLYNA